LLIDFRYGYRSSIITRVDKETAVATSLDRAPIGASRADLITALVLGALASTWVVAMLVVRLIEVLPNERVPVPIWIGDAAADLPIGPDGALIPVDFDGGVALVSDMPGITLASVALADIVPALAAIGVIACVMLLCRNLLAGRAFAAANTRLVTAASILIAAGWAGGLLFTTMANNGAVAVLSEGTYEGVAVTIDWLPLLAATGVGAVAAAFRTGERLQRDTDGLV
jgi:hypothetical protein